MRLLCLSRSASDEQKAAPRLQHSLEPRMADLGALPRITQGPQPAQGHQAAPDTDSGHIIDIPAVAAAAEGLPQIAADGQDVAGREGLLGKLQSKLSISLSRLDPALKPFQQRKASLDASQEATKVAEGREYTPEAVSSPSLDALMPFVPLMFRRDLLLPEPTFSGMQVSSCKLLVFIPTCT